MLFIVASEIGGDMSLGRKTSVTLEAFYRCTVISTHGGWTCMNGDSTQRRTVVECVIGLIGVLLEQRQF